MFNIARLLLLSLFLTCLPLSPAQGFSFSEYEEQEDKGGAQQVSLDQLKCPDSFKSKKIATMIGESHRDDRPGYYRVFAYWNVAEEPNWDRRFGTRKSVYGSLVDNLNASFKTIGLQTYSAEDINAQIAREEQEAFLNNDMDAALSAAERLSADFLLKGNISTLVQTNKVVKVEEVFVTITLSLTDNNGRQLSSAQLSETTFSDADVPATIQRLIAEQASSITNKLFSKTCNGAK